MSKKTKTNQEEIAMVINQLSTSLEIVQSMLNTTLQIVNKRIQKLQNKISELEKLLPTLSCNSML